MNADPRPPMVRVLFLCVHNSARSQIAEGLLHAMVGDRVEVNSAGSEPTNVHPFALRVLRDEGIDVSQHRSKSVDEFLPSPGPTIGHCNRRFDYVITLCADEVCPIFPKAMTRLHWELRDPAAVEGSTEAKLEAFQETVSELKQRLSHFIRENLHDRDETIAG